MKAYAETIRLIERLHRRFLDVLRSELERLGIDDINNVQALLLANVGEEEISVGELMSRGYYLGSNVTYNLKRLVEAKYVEQERSRRDRRVVRIRLTAKGLTLHRHIEAMLTRHEELLQASSAVLPLQELNTQLLNLESFWTDELMSSRHAPPTSALIDSTQ